MWRFSWILCRRKSRVTIKYWYFRTFTTKVTIRPCYKQQEHQINWLAWALQGTEGRCSNRKVGQRDLSVLANFSDTTLASHDFMYMYTYVHTHMQTRECLALSLSLYIYQHICTPPCMLWYMYACIHTYIFIHAWYPWYIQSHTSLHTNIHTYIHTWFQHLQISVILELPYICKSGDMKSWNSRNMKIHKTEIKHACKPAHMFVCIHLYMYELMEMDME